MPARLAAVPGLLAVTGVLVATALTACQRDAPAAGCGGDGEPACYNLAAIQTHCYVEQLRDRFRDGAFTVADLPAEADPELRDEAPVIVDLSVGWPGLSSAQVTDRLEVWRQETGLDPIDDGVRDTCREVTTQDDMVAAYGELVD